MRTHLLSLGLLAVLPLAQAQPAAPAPAPKPHRMLAVELDIAPFEAMAPASGTSAGTLPGARGRLTGARKLPVVVMLALPASAAP